MIPGTHGSPRDKCYFDVFVSIQAFPHLLRIRPHNTPSLCSDHLVLFPPFTPAFKHKIHQNP